MCVIPAYPLHKCKVLELKNFIQIFQRVWSAPVTDERAAWELLSLVDQIHLWATTEFRTFVTEHLKPWHKFCDDNYLVDWKSVYDVKPEFKWMRDCSESTDLPLPSLVKLLNDPIKRKVEARAQKSLSEEREKHHHRKGKRRREIESYWHCEVDQCSASQETYGSEAFLDRLRDLHHCPEDHLPQIRRCLDEGDEIERQERQRNEVAGSGREVRANNNKRCFVDEERLNNSSSDSSSGHIPGPSKRARIT
jgi:hypothetical protein